MNAVWEDQWLSLSCQWELVIWMCVYLWSVISSSIFFSSVNSPIFYLKSSDLSMVNPHISLNPWNPQFHGPILRFSKDFYCEIHGFHWQSSDLAVDLSKSSSRSEGSFILFVWGLVWCLDSDYLLHNLCPSHFQLRCNVFLGAGLSWTQIWTQITDLSVSGQSPLFSVLFIHLIMKSSCLGCNLWIS